MIEAAVDPASFRDPGGQVYHVGEKVYRSVTSVAADDFDFVWRTGLLERLAAQGKILSAEKVSTGVLEGAAGPVAHVIEHPRLPFISYPYEWPFSALKSAALLHLEIHLEALASGVTLSDGSAYNVQFLGPKPVFIDLLSFRPYRDNEPWAGHRQFCEQFLNPLLLRSALGVDHNAWYRGAIDGIDAEALNRLLPWSRKLSLNVITHVSLHAALQRSAKSSAQALSSRMVGGVKFQRSALRSMLNKLHRWIATLEPRGGARGKTAWQDYARRNTYARHEAAEKKAFVEEFTKRSSARLIWDLGCNSGAYAAAALGAGADYAVGFDFDQGALDAAFARASAEDLKLQCVFLDGMNPSPNQGWREGERRGLTSRANADAVLALAFFHHLAIARNVPLDQLVEWTIGLAPTGVVEFVPKTDPKVQELLRFRADIFPDYERDVFLRLVGDRARIVSTREVSDTGRLLVWFDRR